MKSTHYILSIIVLLFSGCNLITDYKLDTNPDYLKEVSLIQYLEEGKESTLTMYLEAIKYAGLEEQISTGNRTRIIPTNDAIKKCIIKCRSRTNQSTFQGGRSAIYFLT